MKLLFEKRKFKKSLFFAKIFIFKLFFHEKCPELGKLQYFIGECRICFNRSQPSINSINISFCGDCRDCYLKVKVVRILMTISGLINLRL